jgi:alcohol dehydrogenase class IV
VGGRYGLPHGTLNAVCLPPALRYNARWAPEPVRRFGEALGGAPVERVEELAALGGATRLRDLDVPAADLPELAQLAAARPGNRANPHAATPSEIEELLRSVW